MRGVRNRPRKMRLVASVLVQSTISLMMEPMSFWSRLFDSGDFLPHAVCLVLRPELIWLHAISDGLIALSYYSIPFALIYFALRRQDLTFRWIFLMFGAFILACGTTHLMGVWTLWYPNYGVEGVIKMVTAIISLSTAALLWPLLPTALALPSPTRLMALNQELENQVAVRRQAEASLRTLNAELARQRRELKDANEKLRASEAHYAAFFNHLAEGLFLIRVVDDDCFCYETMNPAMARASGVNPEQARGRRPEDLLPAADAARQLRHFRDCLRSGHPVEFQDSIEVPAGIRTWHTILVPLRNAEGKVTKLLGSIRDVTEKKRLQEELVQTSKLATLGTLAAGIAHETSQPLNIIRVSVDGCLMMMREGVADPAYHQEVLSLVSEQTKRMGDIIEHMRSLSRRDPDQEKPFDPGGAVSRAIDLVERHYALEDVAVVLSQPDERRKIRGRPLQLEQVLLNLLSNAFDAITNRRQRESDMPPGRIDVELEDDQHEAVVRINIRDNGGGIPPQLIGRLFDPFFTSKEMGKNSGLGLSISYGIISDMGGRIDAENCGTGACFTITLPVSENQSRPVAETSNA